MLRVLIDGVGVLYEFPLEYYQQAHSCMVTTSKRPEFQKDATLLQRSVGEVWVTIEGVIHGDRMDIGALGSVGGLRDYVVTYSDKIQANSRNHAQTIFEMRQNDLYYSEAPGGTSTSAPITSAILEEDTIKASISFDVNDVIDNAKQHDIELSQDQAIGVINMLNKYEDSNIGLSWDVVTDTTYSYCRENDIDTGDN